MPLTSPRLWVVATPIGNLGDLSPRAREVLGKVHTIFAEDTRRAMHLCQLSGIACNHFVSFYDHNEQSRQEEALALLRQGHDIALMSDAGTPLLADPGYRLVRACHAEGIAVSPVPGPSAPVAALSAAGIPPIPYTFLGFLPRQQGAQEELFHNFVHVPTTLAFFERKDRLANTLACACRVLGSREFAVCRELTKIHEEIIIGRLDDLTVLPELLQGELTVLIGPPKEEMRTNPHEVETILLHALRLAGKQREAIRIAQKEISGWNNKELYAMLESLKTRESGQVNGDSTYSE